MGQELIMKLKEVKQALVDLNVHGEEWEERQEILKKLEDVTVLCEGCYGKRESYRGGKDERRWSQRLGRWYLIWMDFCLTRSG